MLARAASILIAATAIALIAAESAAGQAYEIPPDNPFVATAGSAPEVYAYGLRNPWRFSFDLLTGDLLIGDVGGGAREEIDWIGFREARGANFGWPCREGKTGGPVAPPDPRCPAPAPAYVEPLFDYSGSALTAGYVVRDPALTGLTGRALYADFFQGEIRSLALDPSNPGDAATGATVSSLASFGEDAAGRLYVANLDGNAVHRLVSSGVGALGTTPLSGAWDQPIAIATVPGDPQGCCRRARMARSPGTERCVSPGAIAVVPSPPAFHRRRACLLSVAAAPDFPLGAPLRLLHRSRWDIRVDEFTLRLAASSHRALERGQPNGGQLHSVRRLLGLRRVTGRPKLPAQQRQNFHDWQISASIPSTGPSCR